MGGRAGALNRRKHGGFWPGQCSAACAPLFVDYYEKCQGIIEALAAACAHGEAPGWLATASIDSSLRGSIVKSEVKEEVKGEVVKAKGEMEEEMKKEMEERKKQEDEERKKEAEERKKEWR